MPGNTPALPCVVMLPGTLCDGRIFAHQARALRGRARVIRLDYSRLVDRQQWTSHLLATLPARFSIVGFSLGGLWALELLRIAPERIERIALVASNALAASARSGRKSAAFWKLWRDHRSGPMGVADSAKPAYFHARRRRLQHATLVRDMAQRTGSAAAHAEFGWAAERPSGHAALAAFDGPLLVVGGSHDKLCPPAFQRDITRAQPRAEWLQIERCGHFIPLEAPVALSRALTRWIGQQPSIGASGISPTTGIAS